MSAYRKRCLIVIALLLIAAGAAGGAEDRDEPLPAFKASALLAPDVVKGPHHQVADEVRTPGYFHEFTLSSTFGAFEAVGRSQPAVRIHEIAALAVLQDVSKTEVFLAAAGQSVVNVGKTAGGVVTDPVNTAKGVGGGIKRVGVNLGRRTKRAADSVGDSDASTDEAKEGQDSAAPSAAKGALGVSGAMRRWAQKVGVDPYTRNATLRDALDSIAKVDAAGAIVTKVVVPIPAVVGMTSTVGGLVWGKDPEEVLKINEQRLRDMHVSNDVAKALFASASFTLTDQTRLIAALHEVNAEGRADYVRTAAGATSAREALFFVESAEMLQQQNSRGRVLRLLTDSRALVARLQTGEAVALLPLDWVRWTAASDAALREIGSRAKRELGATQLEISLTGGASTQMARAIARLGWTLAPSR